MREISVIIPAYNAGRTIKRCLKAVWNQSYGVSEVIVIDDGSRDDTVQIARKLNCRVIELKNNRGIAAARNAGLRCARGEFFYFVDSDIFPDQNCLEMLMEGFDRSTNVGIVHGPYPPLPLKSNLMNVAYAILSQDDFFPRSEERFTHHMSTANCCVRREVVEDIGYFTYFHDGHRIFDYYEDWDFAVRARRAGYKIFFQPQAIAWHDNQRKSLKSFLIHRYKSGTCGTLLRFKHKPDIPLSRFYPENLVAFLLLTPGIVGYSTTKAMALNIKYRSMPLRKLLLAAPLVVLGQILYGLGAIRGAYLFPRIRHRIQEP